MNLNILKYKNNVNINLFTFFLLILIIMYDILNLTFTKLHAFLCGLIFLVILHIDKNVCFFVEERSEKENVIHHC